MVHKTNWISHKWKVLSDHIDQSASKYKNHSHEKLNKNASDKQMIQLITFDKQEKDHPY